MGRIYIYSFADTEVTISHPSYGSYSAYGTGIGTLSVSYANDITTHEVSADAAVVVSKSVKKNGTVTFDILQASDFNTWLKGFCNYLEAATTSEFAEATIVIRNISTGDNYTATGVSHQKRPDNSLQSTAQNRQWVMMAANIDEK